MDQNYWGRPEDIASARPYYAVPFNVATYNTSAVDLGSSIAAALLAAYASVPTAPNAATYLSIGKFVSLPDKFEAFLIVTMTSYQGVDKCSV